MAKKAEVFTNRIKQIRESIEESNTATSSYIPKKHKKLDIEDELVRAENLKNTAFEQDIILKRNTLIVLFIFLGIETIVVFVLAFFQAMALGKFHLEEWSFKLIITATLLQITYMVKIAVQHLFPQKKS